MTHIEKESLKKYAEFEKIVVSAKGQSMLEEFEDCAEHESLSLSVVFRVMPLELD